MLFMKVVANYFTCLNKVTLIYLLGIKRCFFECTKKEKKKEKDKQVGCSSFFRPINLVILAQKIGLPWRNCNKSNGGKSSVATYQQRSGVLMMQVGSPEHYVCSTIFLVCCFSLGAQSRLVAISSRYLYILTELYRNDAYFWKFTIVSTLSARVPTTTLLLRIIPKSQVCTFKACLFGPRLTVRPLPRDIVIQ